MQSSIACSPHSHANGTLLKLQSHPNLVPTIISPNPNYMLTLFTRTKSHSHLTPRSKYQPQTLLNPSTLFPTTILPTSKSPRTCNSNVSPLLCGISSNGYNANEGGNVRGWVEVVGEALSTAFPLWVTLGCVLGLLKPSYFNWVTPNLIVLGLSIVMLGMGMTLTLDDLRGALAMPKEVLSGFVLQYSMSVRVSHNPYWPRSHCSLSPHHLAGTWKLIAAVMMLELQSQGSTHSIGGRRPLSLCYYGDPMLLLISKTGETIGRWERRDHQMI